MPLALSVIVCTHNPRPDFLDRVLDGLRNQTFATHGWELVVIDNASKESVTGQFDISWHPNGRHFFEPTLGLTPARLRGIAEAKTGLLVFVDDDNILDSDYLEKALQIARDYPYVGAWGGQIRPEFEVDPPEWTKRYWPMLAIMTVERDVWSNLNDQSETTPCGAGMCVRVPIAHEYARACRSNPIRHKLDRTGNSLASCGDSDLALTSCDVGLGTGRFRRLGLTHLIPASRLTRNYLSRLAEEIAYSVTVLRFTRGLRPTLPPNASIITRLINLYQHWRLPQGERDYQLAWYRGYIRAIKAIELE